MITKVNKTDRIDIPDIDRTNVEEVNKINILDVSRVDTEVRNIVE